MAGRGTAPCSAAAKSRPCPLRSLPSPGAGQPAKSKLARLLAGCDVEALGDGQARAVGAIAARAATTDIVDACVVEGALRRHDLVPASSDPEDLQSIASATCRRLEIDHP